MSWRFLFETSHLLKWVISYHFLVLNVDVETAAAEGLRDRVSLCLWTCVELNLEERERERCHLSVKCLANKSWQSRGRRERKKGRDENMEVKRLKGDEAKGRGHSFPFFPPSSSLFFFTVSYRVPQEWQSFSVSVAPFSPFLPSFLFPLVSTSPFSSVILVDTSPSFHCCTHFIFTFHTLLFICPRWKCPDTIFSLNRIQIPIREIPLLNIFVTCLPSLGIFLGNAASKVCCWGLSPFAPRIVKRFIT